MNDKNQEKTIKKMPFDGIIIDAEEVIARNERGLSPQEVKLNVTPDELRGMSRYKRLNTLLGEGGFKKVYKAIDQIEGKEVAWNEIKISESEYNNREKTSFSREINLLNKIKHQSILTILDYWFSREKFVFITEIMSGGTLREYIGNIGEVNVKVIKKWAKQILEGLNYLHSQDPPVIHRDIKCENIFVDSSSGEVKIGDLGVAKEKRLKRYTVVGTPQYMAREMFEGDGYNEKVDIYAFGMCLIEMATGNYPYKECEDSSDVYRSILQGVPPSSLYNVADPCLKNLILRCLVLEKDRLDAKTALQHHFFDPFYLCPGDCIPKESILVKPLVTPGHDMEISLIAFEGDVITFQLFFMGEAKFIKFDYDINIDTVEMVAKEMLEECVVKCSKKDILVNMLTRGVQRALERKETQIKESILENKECSVNIQCIDSTTFNIESEMSNLKIEDDLLVTHHENIELETQNSNLENKCFDSSSENRDEIESARGMSSETRIQSPIENDIKFKKPEGGIETIDSKNESSSDISMLKSPIVNKSSVEELTCKTMVYPIRKYDTNIFIEEFAYDTAEITRRSTESANNWIKILRSNDIYNTTDLRILVDEDWDKLGLSVFISRAMKNMLYGLDQHPLKEKQLPDNLEIKVYSPELSISEFLKEVTEMFNKKECLGLWVNKLLAQDIRTVEELKSLHQEDWDRLGLSLFSYRILKNIIFRKGKFM